MYKSDYLIKTLGDNGHKVTAQRSLIFEVLTENSDKHLSTEEIHELVKSKNSHMGIATIYRTLQLFEEIGLVYKHNFDDGYSRYEIMPQGSNEVHQHHHLLCKKCGKIIEVKEDLMNTLEDMIEKQYDFEILNHVVKFTGICSQCRNKENDNGNRKETGKETGKDTGEETGKETGKET